MRNTDILHPLGPGVLTHHCRRRLFGMTLIELVVSVAVMTILASMAIPLAENSVRRSREFALRESLMRIRESIDRFYDKNDRATPQMPEEDKYPKSLQQLVEAKFLRKIPVDPLTGSGEWLILSYSDKFDEDYFVPNQNPDSVYDVRTTSEETSLDGTRYVTW